VAGRGVCEVTGSVVDPHHFDADPESTFHPDADPDPTFHPDADPAPDPSILIMNLKSAKVGSYSIHFGLSSANRCGSGSGSGSSLSL
jgi:hypothetical protein